MKIEFEVPNWAIGKHIYIFAGRELLGKMDCSVFHEDGKHMTQYSELRLKPADGRCTGCGECCKSCPFLRPQGCLLGVMIPFSCIRSVCTDYEGCTERLEVVK